MPTKLPRARMIQGAPGRNVLYAIYDASVQQNDVVPAARRLSVLPGVRARAIQGSLDGPASPKVTVLEVTFGRGANVRQGTQLLKRLADPELPIAIGLLRMKLLICDCHYISSVLDELRFYTGLEPADSEAFTLRYYARLKVLPVAKLYSSQPHPPYNRLMEGIEAVLTGLGARATVLEVQPQRDLRPCTHAK